MKRINTLSIFIFFISLFVSQKYIFASENYTLLDVRTPEEYSESHLKNAINIDVRNKDFEIQIMKFDKNSIYKIYCRSGHRAGQAIEIMKNKGFEHLENLGGLKEAADKLNLACEGLHPC